MSSLPPDAPILAGATVAQYVEKKWGVKTRLVPLQTVAVLATATRVVKNNPRRFALSITNVGTGQVYLGWDYAVTTATGLLVAPLGGSVILLADEDLELVTYEMVAIAAATGNNLSVWETESV